MERKVVKSIKLKKSSQTVYNIRVKDNHNYFANGILVHNCDDPNSADDSQVTREGTNDWLSRVWPSRLNPGGLGVNVLVQQRTDEMDASGFLMGRDGSWTKLILPMEFEVSRRASTIINGNVWEDPRTQEGELLCPSYLDSDSIKIRKIELGSYNYAGQYQQRPAPQEGGIIKKDWFKWWKEESPPKLEYVIQSWDTALTDKETSAYSACTTWGLFKKVGETHSNLILLSAWRGRVGYPELLKRALRLKENWSDIRETPTERNARMSPDYIIMEAKASGHSLSSDFISKGIPVHDFNPGLYGDKIQRAHRASPYIEAGLVWIAAKPPDYSFLRTDHEMVLNECAIFPKGESNDIVDTVTQAIICLVKEKGMLKHTMDFGFKNNFVAI